MVTYFGLVGFSVLKAILIFELVTGFSLKYLLNEVST